MAISSATAFSTPLGEVPVDAEAFEIAKQVPNVRVFDPPFEDEHSLEVQLPFLQVVLDDFQVLPVLVGQTPPESVAFLIDALWGGEETRIIVSSDLSHYHDYEKAQQLDQHTAELVETLPARGADLGARLRVPPAARSARGGACPGTAGARRRSAQLRRHRRSAQPCGGLRVLPGRLIREPLEAVAQLAGEARERVTSSPGRSDQIARMARRRSSRSCSMTRRPSRVSP